MPESSTGIAQRPSLGTVRGPAGPLQGSKCNHDQENPKTKPSGGLPKKLYCKASSRWGWKASDRGVKDSKRGSLLPQLLNTAWQVHGRLQKASHCPSAQLQQGINLPEL